MINNLLQVAKRSVWDSPNLSPCKLLEDIASKHMNMTYTSLAMKERCPVIFSHQSWDKSE